MLLYTGAIGGAAICRPLLPLLSVYNDTYCVHSLFPLIVDISTHCIHLLFLLTVEIRLIIFLWNIEKRY